MGIFGRSRANTTNQISQPVLTFSDAAPREDLQALPPVETARPYTAKAGRSLNSRGRQDPNQAFDFTVTVPSEGPSASDLPSLNDHGVDANADAIGIALGSPSMAPPPRYPTSASEKQDMINATGSLRRKPSKWKKFGGLLKAKEPEMKRTRQGFYQLDMEKAQEGTVSSVQHLMPQTEVPVTPQRKRNLKTPPPKDQRSSHKVDNHQANVAGSLLKVDIPTVQMERYSVMFRSVLGEKPSSSLLARRSKALDQLHVHDNMPQIPGTYRPQRRGTSPGPGKSPAFGLFPGASHGETTDNNNDSNPFTPPSPVRSNTFPRAAASSRRNHNSHLVVPDLTPALSTGTSFDYSSAEQSPNPFDSPVAIKSHLDGGRPEPVWEMVTKPLPSSMSQETSYKDTSAGSTPAATPLVGTAATSSRTESLSLPRSRKASLPLRTDNIAKPKNLAPRKKFQIDEEDDDDRLLIEKPPAHQQPHQLSRSQTMPLPLSIKKSKPQLHTKASADSVGSSTPKTIEISIARSVSVSRRVPKQTLVPLGATPQAFHNENERFGEYQKLLPTLVNIGGAGGHGSIHRHQKSQDIIIETL